MAYIEFIYHKNTKVNEKLLLENLFKNITIITVHAFYMLVDEYSLNQQRKNIFERIGSFKQQ